MRLACLLVGCLPVFGQAPAAASVAKASPVTKAPGAQVTLVVSADSQPSKEPIALKWEVIFPAQLMEMETGAPELGKAAMDSGKSLQCTARAPYAYVCTLSGGPNTIGNGPIAIFHFKIRDTAAAGTTTLRIQKAESTTADSKKWTLYDTEATVNIQH